MSFPLSRIASKAILESTLLSKIAEEPSLETTRALQANHSIEISTFSHLLNILKICTLRIQHILFAVMRFLENLDCNFYEKSKIQNSRKMETGF